jgi:hypothetical protein
MNRIYIAGKVTGLPLAEVRSKFKQAEDLLRAKGWAVTNPIQIVPQGISWQDSMRICLYHLVGCDAIYLLPDWNDSKGAQLEYTIADILTMEVIYA